MKQPNDNSVVLAIDACGVRGSIALVRLQAGGYELLGERLLPERNEAATIVGAIEEMLSSAGMTTREIGAVVVVDGPGSFTGVRVGVSTALGLSEGLGVPIARVSRLEVLAGLANQIVAAGADAAALDAHRGEIYLRVDGVERLADAGAVKSAGLAGRAVAVCDAQAADLLRAAATDAKLVECKEPTALDALQCARERILAGKFADPMQMDGNYLRRSDAEIFAKPGGAQ
jgi:tRNA threonylcarbamoyladenosine biosynthesis protein TsaB